MIDGTETSLPKQLFSRTHPRMLRVSNSNILQMDPLDIAMAVKQRCEIRTGREINVPQLCWAGLGQIFQFKDRQYRSRGGIRVSVLTHIVKGT